MTDDREKDVAVFMRHVDKSFARWWPSIRWRWVWRFFAHQKAMAEVAYKAGFEVGVRSAMIAEDEVRAHFAKPTPPNPRPRSVNMGE